MLDAKIHDLLKEKIADTTYTDNGEEKKLFDIVIDWHEGLTKVKSANKDLTGQREKWEEERKILKTSITDLETVKNDLDAKLKDATITDEEKKRLEKLKGGDLLLKEEVDKQFNALNETITNLKAEVAESKTEVQKAAELKKQSDMQSQQSALEKSILEELGKVNVVGAQANAALLTIKAGGQAKIIENADGTYGTSFSITKDGKELASDLNSICKSFAEENKWAVSPSGKKGSGENHNVNNGGYNNVQGRTTEEIRNSFAQNL